MQYNYLNFEIKTLALLKHLDIWLNYEPIQACMPMYGHMFFYTSLKFCTWNINL